MHAPNTTGMKVIDRALAIAAVGLVVAAVFVVIAVVPPTGRRYSDIGEADTVAMAAAVLTEPDVGPRDARTLRWDNDVPLSYHVAIPDSWPPEYRAALDDAIAWVGEVTGLDFVRVDEPGSARLQIRAVPEDRGFARVQLNGYEIVAAVVELGCCRTRVPWEEIAQAAGALGDHADARSVFSNDVGAQRGTPFDAWTLAALYALPAGSSVDAVKAQLEATVPNR